MQILRHNIAGAYVELSTSEMHKLLYGEPVEIENLQYPENARGPILAGWSGVNTEAENEGKVIQSFAVGAWIGERLTSMTNKFESQIRLLQLNHTPMNDSQYNEDE